MFRVYWCLSHEHDLLLLWLALLVCGLGSFASMLLVSRTMATREHRPTWSILAGIVSGVSIWSTHYTAMLGFNPGLPISFDPMVAAGSVATAVVLSIAGWTIASGRIATLRGRGGAAFGGLVVGVGLAAAHYLDMAGLSVPGRIIHDRDLMALSIVLGVGLCALAGALLHQRRPGRYPVAASLTLSAAIVLLHFIGMSAIHIVPDPTIVLYGSTPGIGQLGSMVIAASVAVLCVALAVAIYDRRLTGQAAASTANLAVYTDALRASEEHYRFAVDASPQIPWVAGADGAMTEIGPLAAELTGSSTDDLLGSGWLNYLHPDEAKLIPGSAVAWRRGSALDSRFRIRLRDGSYRWFRSRGIARRGADGAIVAWYGSIEDIDDQVVAEAALRVSEERYRLALRATDEPIWDWRHDTDWIDWGGAIGTQLGYPEAEAGTPLSWWSDRVHPDDIVGVQASLAAAMAGGATLWGAEFRFRKADGSYMDIYSRGKIVRDADGAPVRTVGAMLDISERKRTEKNLRWRATHDPLTGLPNRAMFNDRLEAALADAGAGGRGVGLVLLDVDDFKVVNDSFGHATGDALLCMLADRLQRIVPADALVARLGGDEFAIVLEDLDPVEPLSAVVGRALVGLNTVLVVEGRAIECNASVGAASWPADAATAGELLKNADIALNTAKTEDRSSIRIFTGDMRVQLEARSAMLAQAREALADDRIVPFYQPKIVLATNEIAGFEALLRWNHHRNGLQSPRGLAAAFEDVELAGRMTDRMIDRVIADMQVWLEAGVDFRKIALNGSAADFMRGDLSDRLLGALHRADIPTRYLEIEVTETVFVGRVAKNVERTLNTLSAAGVTIALDDFGTGYASLSHLRQFPVDVIKIDQSFVSKLARIDDGDIAIIRAVIALAQSLGLTTVAEGVETAVQATQLSAEGCDLAQGYLFGQAIAASRVSRMITGLPNGLRSVPSVVAAT